LNNRKTGIIEIESRRSRIPPFGLPARGENIARKNLFQPSVGTYEKVKKNQHPGTFFFFLGFWSNRIKSRIPEENTSSNFDNKFHHAPSKRGGGNLRNQFLSALIKTL